MSDKQFFGTDGIRGRVGSELISVDFMLKLGWAAGQLLSQQQPATVLIGRDTRISGEMLQSALQAGLAAAGVDVRLLGVIPTPAVAHLTHSLRAQAGIVISASHNLFEDNGIKFFDADGMKLSDDTEYAIEQLMAKPMQTVPSKQIGSIKSIRDAAGRYIEFCKSTFPSKLNLRGLRIVVDCANGATSDIATKVLHELGAEVIAIHAQPDGYNINHKCGATDVASLQEEVLKQQANLGVAFDGDGDRLIMVDQQGEAVDGDEVLCILAHDDHVARQGIVGTVMSNLGLEQALLQNNLAFARTAVGDRYVLEELLQRGWSLGGEASGHIVDLTFTTTGDGIITALQVLRVMQSTFKPLHVLKNCMTKRPQILLNVPTAKTVVLEDFPNIFNAVREAETALAERGRVLLRPSGTEPLVRVMVEGNDANEVSQLAQHLVAVVQQEITDRSL